MIPSVCNSTDCWKSLGYAAVIPKGTSTRKYTTATCIRSVTAVLNTLVLANTHRTVNRIKTSNKTSESRLSINATKNAKRRCVIAWVPMMRARHAPKKRAGSMLNATDHREGDMDGSVPSTANVIPAIRERPPRRRRSLTNQAAEAGSRHRVVALSLA